LLNIPSPLHPTSKLRGYSGGRNKNDPHLQTQASASSPFLERGKGFFHCIYLNSGEGPTENPSLGSTINRPLQFKFCFYTSAIIIRHPQQSGATPQPGHRLPGSPQTAKK
jgi:hypothetical protein